MIGVQSCNTYKVQDHRFRSFATADASWFYTVYKSTELAVLLTRDLSCTTAISAEVLEPLCVARENCPAG